MKTTIKRAAFIALFSLLIFTGEQSFAAKVPSAPYGSVSFQVFYDELSPYGSWVQYQNYGYAWIPSMGAGFTPYSTGGHWVYTDFGWTWASTYNWGWAPFHYGRWVYDDWYGWMWVPGYEWAPAWVVWGSYNNYYGWAPMGYGYGIGYRPPHNHWVFCQSQYITQVNIHNHIVTSGVPRDRVTIIDNHDSGRGYYYGPRKESVEKNTGRQIPRVEVVERNAPASTKVTGNRMEIYRPEITKAKAAPATVRQLEEVKPVNKTKQPAQNRSAGDDVYQKKNVSPERKSFTQRENTINKQKTEPQRVPNAQEGVQKRDLDMQPRQKSVPQQQVPPVQERSKPDKMKPAPQRVNPPPQERAIPAPQQKMEKVMPEQRSAPMQERAAPQNVPQQKIERMEPQQRSNPPVQRAPAPQRNHAPRQPKVSPR